MIRVLVAEDSPTTREMLLEVLAADPEIEIAGVATNGMEAIRLTEQLHPDVVTMDIHMPLLNGFRATREIMTRTPTPVVILSQYVHTRDVTRCLDAYRAGALTVMPQLPGPGDPEYPAAVEQLRATIRECAGAMVPRLWRIARSTSGSEAAQVVATAVSAADAPLFGQILSSLPADFPAPILVVPNVGRRFSEAFAAWLARNTALDVRMAADGEPICTGTVYVAPDDRHLGLTVGGDCRMQLSTADPIGGFRPSALFLFESVAGAFGPSSLALVFPGMRENAVMGLCALALEGGRILAVRTDEGSCRSRAASLAVAIADAALPPERLAAELVQCTTTPAGEDQQETDAPESEDTADYSAPVELRLAR